MPVPEARANEGQKRVRWTVKITTKTQETRWIEESISVFGSIKISWAYLRPDGSPTLWAMAEEVASKRTGYWIFIGILLSSEG